MPCAGRPGLLIKGMAMVAGAGFLGVMLTVATIRLAVDRNWPLASAAFLFVLGCLAGVGLGVVRVRAGLRPNQRLQRRATPGGGSLGG